MVESEVKNENRDLITIRKEAAENIEKSQIQNKTYHDKKRKKPQVYKVGDLVMIRDFDNAPGLSRKLIPKIEGPYVIKSILQNDRYCVSDIEGFQNTAKPYEGTWEAVNMRL